MITDSEIGRCWVVYLNNIDRKESIAFRDRMEERLPTGTRVRVWPTVWPSVLQVFSPTYEIEDKIATENFVRAVQYAEKVLTKG